MFGNLPPNRASSRSSFTRSGAVPDTGSIDHSAVSRLGSQGDSPIPKMKELGAGLGRPPAMRSPNTVAKPPIISNATMGKGAIRMGGGMFGNFGGGGGDFGKIF